MSIRTGAVLGAAAIIVAGAFAPPAQAAKRKKPRDVTVMTRNIYLGGDITRPLTAVEGAPTPIDTLIRFGNANAELRRIVDETDFPARAKLLAREIKREKPDFVGLQEVSIWRSGPMQLDQLGVSNAEDVAYDFLKTLRAELRKAKAPYTVVRRQQESDVEGPAFTGSDFTNAPDRRDERLTISDVLLKRKTSKVKVLKTGSTQYDARINVELSGVTFSFIRGAAWADARLGKKRFRVITTHLESQGDEVRPLQAQELLAGPANVKRPVIVVCDCNSGPTGTDVNVAPTAYGILTGQPPYSVQRPLFDAWPKGPATSGFNELVNDADTSGLQNKIDLVLTRGANGRALKVTRRKRIGTTVRTPGGLWPSDHAGVVARVRVR